MNWHHYYELVLEHPEAVDAVESRIAFRTDAARVEVAELASSVEGVGVSYDQVAAVLCSLADIRVLRRESAKAFVVDGGAIEGTGASRQAARSALRWAATQKADAVEMLVAEARDWPDRQKAGQTRRFADLRTTIRARIAEAQRTIVLAAPYWDLDVADDLGEVLERRLRAGVRLRILARKPRAESPNDLALRRLQALSGGRSVAEVMILDRPSAIDPFGSSTFHFKAAVFDEAVAYVGSANFNTAGFGSRWELGVLLRGSRAESISSLIDWLLESARPIAP